MAPPRWTWLAGAALLISLSYWMGRRNSAHSETGARSPASAATAVRPIVVERTSAPGSSSGLDREELRAVVREELARDAAEREGAEAPVEEAADPERADRVAQAVTAATTAIEAGIVDGVWDARDREALREQLPHLGERETHAVLSPLFQAVNAQRVKLDGPPI
jgi:hypothetical protein